MQFALIFLLFVSTKNAESNVLITEKDVQCVAETLYSEARGEEYKGIVSVGNTIVNRHKKLKKKICTIVKTAYTQKRIIHKDKEKFYIIARDVLYKRTKNFVGERDSFDSYKHRYYKHKNHTTVKIGHHYFYQVLYSQ